MNADWDFLGPVDEAERIDLVAGGLAVSVQLALQKAMVRGGVSQKELAERMGVSPARVSQYLSAHGRNLTLQVLGRIAHALGEDFEFVALHDLRDLKARAKGKDRQVLQHLAVAYDNDRSPWTDLTANINKFPEKIAA
jgi:transcriptional regulator with XRE-family HTH domain